MAISKHKNSTKRAVRWMSRFYLSNGEQKSFESLRDFPLGTTKREALEIDDILIKREEQMLTDANGGGIPSLEFCVDRWLENYAEHLKGYKNYKSHADCIRPYLVGKTIGDVVSVANDILEAMSAGHYSNATIRQRMGILQRTAKKSFQVWGYLDTDEGARMKLPRPPKGREVYLEIETVDKIVAYCDHEMVKHLIVFSAQTGIRHAELQRLKDGCIWNGKLVIEESKEGTTRVIDLSPDAIEAARNLSFPIDTSYDSIYKWFAKAIKAAGLSDVKWHDLRHTFASLMLNNGMVINDLQYLMGHSDIRTTIKYTHKNRADSTLVSDTFIRIRQQQIESANA